MRHWKYLFFASCTFLGSLQADWTTSPTTIDSGDASSAAPLVVDTEGNVTSAWLENYAIIGDDPQAAFFSNSSQQWMQPQSIIQAGAGLSMPQLIVDAFGTVTLVWLEYFNENANSITLFASRSTQGGPWTAPVPLNSLSEGNPTNAQVPVSMVVDGQGNVTIAWLEQDINSSNYAIGTARFTSDINVLPTLYPFLDGAAPNANNLIPPQLLVDQLGYVTAVWQEQTGSGFAVQTARLDPSGSNWTTPINLDDPSPNANSAIAPQAVVDASGIVTIVWQEQFGAQFSVQAARFTPGMGGIGGSWMTYTALAPALSNANGTITPQIVVDKNGSVTIVAVDASLSVWPSSFAYASSSWTFPMLPLNTGTAFSLTPLSMVADDSGIVTILWLNNNSALFVQAARGFSTSWNPAVNLNTGNADGNTPLLVVVDPFGTVTVSWMEVSEMQAARFLSGGSSWTPAATLNNGNLYNQIPQKMIVGPSGAVTVIWQEGPNLLGSYAIQAARFTPGEFTWTSPLTLNNGLQFPNAFYSSMTQQINAVVDAFDNVTVTWLEVVNSFVVVQSARFSPPLPPPPPAPSGGAARIFTNSLDSSITITSGRKVTLNSGTVPSTQTKIESGASDLNLYANESISVIAGSHTNAYSSLESGGNINIQSAAGDVVLEAGSVLGSFASMTTTNGGNIHLLAPNGSVHASGGSAPNTRSTIVTQEGGDIEFNAKNLFLSGGSGTHSQVNVVTGTNNGCGNIQGSVLDNIQLSKTTVATGFGGGRINLISGNNIVLAQAAVLSTTAGKGTRSISLIAGDDIIFDNTASLSMNSTTSLIELVVDNNNPMSVGSGRLIYPAGAKIQNFLNKGSVRIYTASPMNNLIETNAVINGLEYPPPSEVADHEVYNTFYPTVPPPLQDGSKNYTIYYKTSSS